MGCFGDLLIVIGVLLLFSPGLPFGMLLIVIGMYVGGRGKEMLVDYFTGEARPFFGRRKEKDEDERK